MKKVIVFDVENVLFDVKRIENWLRVIDNKEVRNISHPEYYRYQNKGFDMMRLDYLEKYFKTCPMYEGVRENINALLRLKKIRKDDFKVFLVSSYDKRYVLELLGVNGMFVDGVFENIEKLIEKNCFNREDVVYFTSRFVYDQNGEVVEDEGGLNRVLCKWSLKKKRKRRKGINSFSEMWKEIGLTKAPAAA